MEVRRYMKLSNIKAKLLIIDDDADIRNAVRQTLESELESKIKITEANNVASGLRALKKTKPDVVILDIVMPGESGIDFLHRLDNDKSLPKTKIIILTANANIKNITTIEGIGENVYHFVYKPFINSELQALVLNLIVPRATEYS